MVEIENEENLRKFSMEGIQVHATETATETASSNVLKESGVFLKKKRKVEFLDRVTWIEPF